MSTDEFAGIVAEHPLDPLVRVDDGMIGASDEEDPRGDVVENPVPEILTEVAHRRRLALPAWGARHYGLALRFFAEAAFTRFPIASLAGAGIL